MTIFNEFIDGLLEREGGYVNRSDDSGGATKYGITEFVARKYGYKGDMRNLPKSFAIEVYYETYWKALYLHEIETFSPIIAEKIADIAVNMGVERAGEFTQRLLNVFNDKEKYYRDIRVDGQIGPVTTRTLRRFLDVRQRDGESVFWKGLNSLQGAFYITLAERREKDEAFVFGWLRTRVGDTMLA